MKIMVVLLLCVGMAYTSLETDWGDWSHFKGSSQRTGFSDTPAPDTPFLLWDIDTGSELYSSPVVQSGKVFQIAQGKVLCIDCDTGELLWTSSVGASNSTPALTDDAIIVVTNFGATALSMKDGSSLWEYTVSERPLSMEDIDEFVSSPAVYEGKVVIGTLPYVFIISEGTGSHDDLNPFIVCLDETTGEEKWLLEDFGITVFSSPCIAHKKIFFGPREILCFDLESGDILWNSEQEYPFEPYNSRKPNKDRYAFSYSTPAVYHGFLVAGSSYSEWQKIVAIDQYTGRIFWEWIEEGGLASSPAISKGKIYFYSHDGNVRCLSLLDGEELWKTPISEPKKQKKLRTGFVLWSSPAVADNKVYIGSIEGFFYCLDAHSGEVLWKYRTEGPIQSSPAITSGKVLISSTDGRLYCFGIDPETYTAKAKKYLEDEDYGKAEEILIKAREYVETDEDIKEIDTLLDVVASQKQEYRTRVENLSEAEALMDEADNVLWNSDFGEAKNLYTKASALFKELNDEFGVSFCEKRIDYIEERIMQQGEQRRNYLLLSTILAFIIALVILIKRYGK